MHAQTIHAWMEQLAHWQEIHMYVLVFQVTVEQIVQYVINKKNIKSIKKLIKKFWK